MVMENFGGKSVAQELKSKDLDSLEKLLLVINITGTMVELCPKQRLQLQFHGIEFPENLIFNPFPTAITHAGNTHKNSRRGPSPQGIFDEEMRSEFKSKASFTASGFYLISK